MGDRLLLAYSSMIAKRRSYTKAHSLSTGPLWSSSKSVLHQICMYVHVMKVDQRPCRDHRIPVVCQHVYASCWWHPRSPFIRRIVCVVSLLCKPLTLFSLPALRLLNYFIQNDFTLALSSLNHTKNCVFSQFTATLTRLNRCKRPSKLLTKCQCTVTPLFGW